MQQPASKPRVCKSGPSQISSSHAKGTSDGSLPKNDSLLSVLIQNLIESRKKHPNNVLICYLNINSLRYKVVDLRTLLSKFLPHYFVLAETKLGESFPNSQFVIDQYEIRTRRDRKKNGGALIEYVRKGLVCKAFEDTVNLNSQIILSDINIKNNKWAIFSAYGNTETFLGDLSNLLNKNLSKYDNVIIMDDFNIDVKDKTNPHFDKFFESCDTFSLPNLIKDYTCFTKSHKSSIDLIVTNKEHSFQLTKKTGVSD